MDTGTWWPLVGRKSRGKGGTVSAPQTVTTNLSFSLPLGLGAFVVDIPSAFSGVVDDFVLAPGSPPLPTGLSLASNGMISGTPSEIVAGLNVTIRATNASGYADTNADFTIFALDYVAAISGMTSLVAYGDAAVDGTIVTAEVQNPNGPAPGSTTFTWSTLESGLIASGASPDLLVDAGAYDGESLYCEISPDPYPQKATPSVVIRHQPPVAANGIADQSSLVGQDASAVDASADFTGSDISFALAPSSAPLPNGLSLSATGQIGGTPVTAASEVNVVVRGTNSGGSADTGFGWTVVAAPAVISISAVGPQGSDGDVPLAFTIDRDDGAIECVVFAAAEADPVATDFNGGGRRFMWIWARFHFPPPAGRST